MSEMREDAPPPARGLEAFFDRHHRPVLWAMLAVALVLRLITFVELSSGPSPRLNTFEDTDMAWFNAWGKQLARGEYLLSEGGLTHPLHTWHRRVAEEYLSVRPEALGGREWNELEPIEQLDEEGKLWNDWYGDKVFHQEPLYPYLLALCYGVSGQTENQETDVIQFLQMLVGVATIALLYQVSRIYFGNLVALVAAAMVTLHAPLMHYEFFILRAPLICFAGLLLVYLAERLRADPTPARWFGFGVACGLATALKASFGLFGLALAVYMAWARQQRGLTGIRLGLWGTGALAALAPVFLRNLLVGAPVFAITSIGKVTFAVTNHQSYVANTNWTVDAPMLAEIMGEGGGGWFSTIAATLSTHEGIGSYLGLLWAKFCQIWQWFDVPNNTNFYFVRKFSTVLSALPVSFTILAALGLVGIGAACIRKRYAVPLLMLIGVAILQMVAFYVLARFRLPMTVALAPFSALGLVSLWQWVRQREFRRAAVGAGVAVALVLWIQRDISPERPDLDTDDYAVSGDYNFAHTRYYVPLWQAAVNAGDLRRAEELLEEALAIRPNYLDGIDINTRRIRTPQLLAVEIYWQTYQLYGETLKLLGDEEGAERNLNRAKVLRAIARSAVPGQGG